MDIEKIPEGYEWCRKKQYEVKVERGCYPVSEKTPILEDFEVKEFEINGEKKPFAVKRGFNILERNEWITSPNRPYIITGTVGERWPVKPSNMSAYEVDLEQIGIEPTTISTKDPSNQEFLVAIQIPIGEKAEIVPKWAFGEDGKIDRTQIMTANSESSIVDHNGGDYVVAKHIPGEPEYWSLSEAERNTKEAASKYDPRIINGSVMETTYDHAETPEEIIKRNITPINYKSK